MGSIAGVVAVGCDGAGESGRATTESDGAPTTVGTAVVGRAVGAGAGSMIGLVVAAVKIAEVRRSAVPRGVVAGLNTVETVRAELSATDNAATPREPSADAEPGARTNWVVAVSAPSGAPRRSGVMLSARNPTSSRLTVAVEAMRMRPARDAGSWGGAASSDG